MISRLIGLFLKYVSCIRSAFFTISFNTRSFFNTPQEIAMVLHGLFYYSKCNYYNVQNCCMSIIQVVNAKWNCKA